MGLTEASDVVIVDAVRTPLGRGRPGGLLSGTHPVDLLALVLESLVERTGVPPAAVSDVIGGCVSQVGEQTFNITRHAVLAAGFPESVPAVTIDRQCGSSQQAVHFAVQGIMAGQYDLAIACGVEMMSRVPLGSASAERDPYGPMVTSRYSPGLIPQGVAAELIASRWKIPRLEMDTLSLESHRRAAAATDAGFFASEIVPVEVTDPQGNPVVVNSDEGIRRDSTIKKLTSLPSAFEDEDLAERFPEIDWNVTAGNSSQVTDGAAAVLVASRRRASELGLMPRASFKAMAVVGDDPLMMLTGVIPATLAVLSKAKLGIDDVGAAEINEAFASVVLAWQRELLAEPTLVNKRGGAIALGHPVGASGARLMTTLLGVMEAEDHRFGLQAMCEGGGLANATILELES